MTSYGYRCVLLRWNSPPTDPAMQAKKNRLKKSARCTISVGPVVVLVVQLVAIESNVSKPLSCPKYSYNNTDDRLFKCLLLSG